jgi:hypothetical protein
MANYRKKEEPRHLYGNVGGSMTGQRGLPVFQSGKQEPELPLQRNAYYDQPSTAFPAELIFGETQLGRFPSDLSAHLSDSYPNYASGLMGSKSTSKLGAGNITIMDSLDAE